MCKHAEQLGFLVNKFQYTTYPHLNMVLLHAMQCKAGNTDESPESQVAKEVITSIKSEFVSLITYEQKLVFPAILRLFGKKDKAEHTPDLANLLQLTKSKEHKIQCTINTLDKILQTEALEKYSGCQLRVIEDFNQVFFPEKEAWNALIAARIDNCACFRKGFIQSSGFVTNPLNTTHE